MIWKEIKKKIERRQQLSHTLSTTSLPKSHGRNCADILFILCNNLVDHCLL